MNEQDSEKTWFDYHERIKKRRMTAAKVIDIELERNAKTDETNSALDFSFFSPDEAGAVRFHMVLYSVYGQ